MVLKGASWLASCHRFALPLLTVASGQTKLCRIRLSNIEDIQALIKAIALPNGVGGNGCLSLPSFEPRALRRQ